MVSHLLASQRTVNKLTSNNYATWKFKLKHLLIAKELFGYCDGSMKEPTTSETAKKAFKLNAQKALSQFVLSISDEVFYLITECETAQKAWEKLQSHFEQDTLANRRYLKKQYFRAVMKNSDSVEDYLKYLKDIINRLTTIKAPVSNKIK